MHVSTQNHTVLLMSGLMLSALLFKPNRGGTKSKIVIKNQKKKADYILHNYRYTVGQSEDRISCDPIGAVVECHYI